MDSVGQALEAFREPAKQITLRRCQALDGAIVTYSITFLEVIQALGVAAILAIAFVLGLKIFAMLPTEALMEDEAS